MKALPFRIDREPGQGRSSTFGARNQFSFSFSQTFTKTMCRTKMRWCSLPTRRLRFLAFALAICFSTFLALVWITSPQAQRAGCAGVGRCLDAAAMTNSLTRLLFPISDSAPADGRSIAAAHSELEFDAMEKGFRARSLVISAAESRDAIPYRVQFPLAQRTPDMQLWAQIQIGRVLAGLSTLSADYWIEQTAAGRYLGAPAVSAVQGSVHPSHPPIFGPAAWQASFSACTPLAVAAVTTGGEPLARANRSSFLCFERVATTSPSAVCVAENIMLSRSLVSVSTGGEEVESVMGRDELEELPAWSIGAWKGNCAREAGAATRLKNLGAGYITSIEAALESEQGPLTCE
jgi:hypothetical protein